MDSRAQQAREHHLAAQGREREAYQHREIRDRLIRDMHASGEWSYSRIARAVGCTPELVAKIVKPQRR